MCCTCIIWNMHMRSHCVQYGRMRVFSDPYIPVVFNPMYCCFECSTQCTVVLNVQPNVLLLWMFNSVYCYFECSTQCTVFLNVQTNVLLFWMFNPMYYCFECSTQCTIVLNVQPNVLLFWMASFVSMYDLAIIHS